MDTNSEKSCQRIRPKPNPCSFTSDHKTKTKDTEDRKDSEKNTAKSPHKQYAIIVTNRVIGLEIAPCITKCNPQLNIHNLKIVANYASRPRPNQAHPCTPYSNRDAQRTSGRERN